MDDPRPSGARELLVSRVSPGAPTTQAPDFVAVEEPLDIQLGYSGDTRLARTVSITMRTPGNDRELAAGFLFTEGILRNLSPIAAILEGRNSVRVELKPGIEINWPALERHVYTSSSCGVCGKTSIDAVRAQTCTALGDGPLVDARILAALPDALRSVQRAFDATGGLHAAAFFDTAGRLLTAREDVGRHNALDKLLGHRFLRGELPASDLLLAVSGRASFELVQKALTAGVAVLAAVGAPSSLAVDLAHDARMTLAGFVRNGGFNLYSGAFRVRDTA